jgi:hypothetical protein
MTLTISQIVNFKMVEDDLGRRKCYQCGGETLVPVVKHSVSDSTPWINYCILATIYEIYVFCDDTWFPWLLNSRLSTLIK